MCSFIHTFWRPADIRYLLSQKMTKDAGAQEEEARTGGREEERLGSCVSAADIEDAAHECCGLKAY